MTSSASGTVRWGDLKKKAEDALKPLPEGTLVNVIVEKAEAKFASTGSLMIAANLAVYEGPYQNRKIFNNFVLTPDNDFAMNMFFARMGAFGIDGAFFDALSAMEGAPIEQHMAWIAEALVGRKAALTMAAPRAYQGVERDNPGSFAAIPGQPPAVFNPSAATGGAPGLGGAVTAAATTTAPSIPASTPAAGAPTIGGAPSIGSPPPAPPEPAF